jgi:hypothetical protein
VREGRGVLGPAIRGGINRDWPRNGAERETSQVLQKMLKLHLGRGKRHIPGYIHMDGVDFPRIDRVTSIDNLSFIRDNTVDVIYNCHVLEHFKRRDVPRVLQEWHRRAKTKWNIKDLGPRVADKEPKVACFDPVSR